MYRIVFACQVRSKTVYSLTGLIITKINNIFNTFLIISFLFFYGIIRDYPYFGRFFLAKFKEISRNLVKTPEISLNLQNHYPKSSSMDFIIEKKKTAKIQYPPPSLSIRYSEKTAKAKIRPDEMRLISLKIHRSASRF